MKLRTAALAGASILFFATPALAGEGWYLGLGAGWSQPQDIHYTRVNPAGGSILLNNGVFGETGGHMTATSVIGQRTKNSLDGRDAEYHGYPILIGDLIAQLQGASYVARGSVHNAGSVARTRKMFKRAFESQLRGEGFTFVEVLTMCPTGWFVPTADGPDYMQETLGEVHIMGELKVDGRVRTTDELHAENVAKQREIDEQLARGGIEK